MISLSVCVVFVVNCFVYCLTAVSGGGEVTAATGERPNEQVR